MEWRENTTIVEYIWDYVLDTAEQMAQANLEEHERTLFIMHCLFAMYLRISRTGGGWALDPADEPLPKGSG
jgi:hypothetical protein